eukprot:3981276-Prymnesium_polylepis.2
MRKHECDLTPSADTWSRPCRHAGPRPRACRLSDKSSRTETEAEQCEHAARRTAGAHLRVAAPCRSATRRRVARMSRSRHEATRPAGTRAPPSLTASRRQTARLQFGSAYHAPQIR